MADYFTQRNQSNIKKLKEIRAQLPSFCSEYFLGVEQRTTPLTRLNYACDLRIFFNFLANEKLHNIDVLEINLSMLNAVNATDLELYLEYLGYYKDSKGVVHGNNEKAKARALSSIRSLFKYFFNKDKLDSNVASKVEQPKLHAKDIVRLETDEVASLLDQAESGDLLSRQQSMFHDKTKLRDLAILTLFLGTGIRVSELIGLNINDINFNDNSFKVTRKGGNQVILYFSNEVAEALMNWIARRHENSALIHETALFVSLQNHRICVRAVENLVKKYARIITPLKKISPHKLRSTYGTNLYRETKDIYVVAEVLGHKDVNTTKKHYAAIGEDIRRAAANKVVLREDDTLKN